jgi:hypothetical protein
VTTIPENVRLHSEQIGVKIIVENRNLTANLRKYFDELLKAWQQKKGTDLFIDP